MSPARTAHVNRGIQRLAQALEVFTASEGIKNRFVEGLPRDRFGFYRVTNDVDGSREDVFRLFPSVHRVRRCRGALDQESDRLNCWRHEKVATLRQATDQAP